MLAGYRLRAGLQPKAEGYGGWDSTNGKQLTGHVAGHYLSAVSLMYAATGDSRFKERAAYLVQELKEVQDRRGNGYLGAITDREGRIKFLSQTAQRLVGSSQEEASGRHWAELFPVREEERAQLRHLAAQRAKTRKKLQIHFETPEGKHYWIDIEVQDEPGNPDRKILFFYDMSEIYDLRRMLDEKVRFHDLTGRSDQMRMIYQQIQEISNVDWTVLIEGETGTGKELVARAIHYSSPGKDKPFVPVNCAGLTDSLLTSQLFGHKRGAFTGAIEDHVGLFEAANGGTIFLDEIGDISLNVQTNLLRVLLSGKYCIYHNGFLVNRLSIFLHLSLIIKHAQFLKILKFYNE